MDNNNKRDTHYSLSSPLVKLKRIIRSIKMWGLHRTIAKGLSRISLPVPVLLNFVPKRKSFILVGCGQFGLSTASFFIGKKFGNIFLSCFDIDINQSKYAQASYGYSEISNNFDDLISLDKAKYCFIASNHASHTEQAIKALSKGLTVHVEKPISVNWEQLNNLKNSLHGKEDKFFVGYNRPFSKAITILRNKISSTNEPLTMQFFIAGHSIAKDHWYYNPDEGSRICGNLGHWIDLAIHLLAQKDMPSSCSININFADIENREENFILSITSDIGDIINMIFSTRGEPFDGVNETLNIQQGELIAKIDDFQRMKIWHKDFYKHYKFWPKDVGHAKSVTQMFKKNPDYLRPWSETYLSTAFMLHISDMVRDNVSHSKFSFDKFLLNLNKN